MNKLYTLVFLLVFSNIFSQQRGIKPKVMIVPSNAWMTQNGFVKTTEEQGAVQKEFQYAEAFDNDPTLNSVINRTGAKFAERGFNLTDMQSEIKSLNARIEKNAITGRTLNLLDELAMQVSADIVLELDFNIGNAGAGRKIVDRFSMTAKDAYSNEIIAGAGMPGAPSSSPSVELLVVERVEAFINNLEAEMKRVFQGYVENGRKARIEIIAAPDAVDFGCYDYYGTTLPDGRALFEFFEDWAYEKAYKGRGNAEPSPSGETVNIFINIPLVDENGRNVNAMKYCTQFLRDAGLRSLFVMRPEQVGLGHAILNINDCK
tara:strand:- start:1056 stop:2009 length:954 start_codon:yes stop_codon:yes gene_type:complete